MNFYYTDKVLENGNFERIKSKTTLEYDKCNKDGYGFNFTNQTEVEVYGINDYYCLKNRDYML